MQTHSNGKFQTLKKRLLSEREDLSKKIHSRLHDVSVESEPDDEVAQATGSMNRDMMVGTLERERRTLEEIEAALDRIALGEYGVCESCEEPIADARLNALPWARQCISCANNDSASPIHYLRLRAAS